MMNIDSKIWSVRSYNDGYAHIIQRASNETRTVQRSTLPSADSLAQMNETRFDAVLREAFHGAGR